MELKQIALSPDGIYIYALDAAGGLWVAMTNSGAKKISDAPLDWNKSIRRRSGPLSCRGRSPHA